MPSSPFSRPTIIAAVEFLERLTQAQFNQLVVRLGLEDKIPSETEISVGKKCAELSREVANSPDRTVQTVEGEIAHGEAVVMEAIKLTNQSNQDLKQTTLVSGLARDGYTISWGSDFNATPILPRALPDEIDLHETDDEVHQLLKHFQFETSLGHLKQVIDAHAGGNWAAANGQIRSFLESLFDEIAQYLYPSQIGQQVTSENKRALLAQNGFLLESRNEWTPDGKNFLNGLFKMLHTEGSHAGLSDEDHCTFRLHIVLVTARTFLRRL